MSTDERAVEAADDWRILLPPGWLTLPTERKAATAAITRLLDSVMRGKPRDELVDVRIRLDRILREHVRQARRAGAEHVHALVRPIEGVPVTASVLTRRVETAGDPDELASLLKTMLGEATGVVENGFVDLRDRGALRRVRRWRATLDLDGSSTEQLATAVDCVVPLDDTSVLVMAFSTTTEPVQQELVVLFDAIASTLHRHPAPAGDR